MNVLNVDKNDKTTPVKTQNMKMTRQEFSDRFRQMNARGKR